MIIGGHLKNACLKKKKMHVYSRKTCFQVILNDHPLIPNVLVMVLRRDVLILCKRKMNQITSPDHSPRFGLARVRGASESCAP